MLNCPPMQGMGTIANKLVSLVDKITTIESSLMFDACSYSCFIGSMP